MVIRIFYYYFSWVGNNSSRRTANRRESFLHGSKKLSLPASTGAESLEAIEPEERSNREARRRLTRRSAGHLSTESATSDGGDNWTLADCIKRHRWGIAPPKESGSWVELRGHKRRQSEMGGDGEASVETSWAWIESQRPEEEVKPVEEVRLSRERSAVIKGRPDHGDGHSRRERRSVDSDVPETDLFLEGRRLNRERRSDMMNWSSERVGLEWLFEHTDSETDCTPGKRTFSCLSEVFF